MQLGKEGALQLGSVRHFVLDECDKMLDKTGAILPRLVWRACHDHGALLWGGCCALKPKSEHEPCVWR